MQSHAPSSNEFFRTLIVIFVFAGTFGLPPCGVESADPVSPKEDETSEETREPDFRIRKSLPIKTMLGGQYHIVADLGALPSGSQGVVEFEIVNPSDSDFSVRDAEVSCNCAKAVLASDEIKAFSSVALTVQLKTPKSSSNVTSAFTIKLLARQGEARDITIVARYRLNGLLCFRQPHSIYQLDRSVDIQTILIPINLTAPVDANSVIVEVSPVREGLLAQIEKQDNSYFVKLSVDTELIADEGLHGQLIMRSKDNAASGQTLISLWQAKELEISPRTIRFRSSDDRYTASCLIRHRAVSSDGPSKKMHIEASIAGEKLKVKQTRLGDGIYRVQISKSAAAISQLLDQKEGDRLEVIWNILSGKKRFQKKSGISISPSLFVK